MPSHTTYSPETSVQNKTKDHVKLSAEGLQCSVGVGPEGRSLEKRARTAAWTHHRMLLLGLIDHKQRCLAWLARSGGEPQLICLTDNKANHRDMEYASRKSLFERQLSEEKFLVFFVWFFWGNSILFSIVTIPIYIPTNSAKCSFFLHIFNNTCYFWCFL